MVNRQPFKFPDHEKLQGDEFNKAIRSYWNKVAQWQLVGRTIEDVLYMKPEEAEENMWYKAPVKIWLTAKPGNDIISKPICMIPSSDDEGNDGGALHFEGYESDEHLLDTCLPTM